MDTEGRVAYVGTFSKLLSPALRIGYVVAPRPLHDRIAWLKLLTDHHAPWPLQRALASFVGEGHLERHVRRMRRHYAAKRAVLIAALAPLEHLVRPLGLEAGLHCCLELRPGLDATAIARRAHARSVVVTTLDSYYFGQPDRQGLLLGYGGLSLGDVGRGASILAECIGRAAAIPRLAAT
jgi:GntR family transcriptional regulator/MocR family aminotransferase